MEESNSVPATTQNPLGIGRMVIFGVVDSRTKLVDLAMMEYPVHQEFQSIRNA